MEGFTLVLSLLSGVALFLFGMSLMGDGLKKAAGEKLELILYELTNTPLKGILLGTVVTAIIQSSSATTVMVVGFVNAGMMKVSQAIGIIMGANIGTSITGWILCLSYIEGTGGIAQLLSTATISAVVAIVGIIFKTFLKKASYHNVGDIMLGFAILMTGMQTMSGAMAPLKSNPHFIKILTMFSNPFMGILLGILFTAVLQSASASVGILQALSVTGDITFAAALPITMGIGVGAACPVLLSSIGTNKNGKRTALIYLLNDLFGMLIWSIVFYTVHAFVHFNFMDMGMNPVKIALMNTVFRMATILVLSPFIKWIEKLVFILVKDTEEDKADQADFDLLEERFLAYPPLAIAQSHLAMNGMATRVMKNIARSLHLLEEYTEEEYNKVQEKENLIDRYEDKVGSYLMQLTGREMTAAQNSEVSKFLHTVGDFERLGDHASNISKVANELQEKSLAFTDEGSYELGVLESAITDIVNMTVKAFQEDDLVLASKVEPLRELITVLCSELKLRHVKRLRHGKCDMKQGFAFNDLLASLERIGAHCSNIAVAMIELSVAEFDTHSYIRNIREGKNADYIACFEEYEEKYDINGYKKAKKAKKEDVKKADIKKEIKKEIKRETKKKKNLKKLEAKKLETKKLEEKKEVQKKTEVKKLGEKKDDQKKEEAKKSGGKKLESKKSEPKKSELDNVELKKAELEKVELKKPESDKSEQKSDSKNLESKKPESDKTESDKLELDKAGKNKSESGKPESLKQELLRSNENEFETSGTVLSKHDATGGKSAVKKAEIKRVEIKKAESGKRKKNKKYTKKKNKGMSV